VWHLSEGVVKIAGRSCWLWRAVDQYGVILGEILQARRDKRAAKRPLVKLMKRAKREVAPSLDHSSHMGRNNRAKNSHLPYRKRERAMQGFRSPGALQGFVSTQSATRNRFSVPARRRSALTIRYHRLEACKAWKSVANVSWSATAIPIFKLGELT
jgi:putative transposase